MKKLIAFLLCGVMLLSSGCCIGGNITEEPQNTAAQVETVDPLRDLDFAMYDAEGNSVMLSDYAGKPIVLNFWASWCGPCKMEMPEFQQAYETYGDQVNFLMVSVMDDEDDAKELIASTGYTFPVFYDLDDESVARYDLSAIPQSYFFNAKGELVDSVVGMIDADALQAYLDAIM